MQILGFVVVNFKNDLLKFGGTLKACGVAWSSLSLFTHLRLMLAKSVPEKFLYSS